MMRAPLVAGAALLLLSACGDDETDTATAPTTTAAATTTTTAAVDREPTLVYEINGGCQMMGPNCATYFVYDDGTVEIYRTGENDSAEITGSIPAAEVAAWLESIANVDYQSLADEVGPGTCNACVDGVDVKATINLADGPVVLDSTVIAFDPASPFFANLESLMNDVYPVGELPLEQR